MKRFGVALEFQITSNVRLNNLSHLEKHPLRQYLRAGVRCVQGTDGCALYGTNSIDEELSLEKLLGLSHQELCRMRRAEDEILAESLRVFRRKEERFRESFPGGDLERYYASRLEQTQPQAGDLWRGSGKHDAEEALRRQIAPLPEGMLPLVIAGGSFNNSRHRSQLREADRAFIDALLDGADPEKIFFVVGHSLAAQEGYLVRRAAGRFRVFAIVPSMISSAERARLSNADLSVVLSIESSPLGLYKSFGYEIFRRMPSALLAFDGNSAAENLIQEARNGREKCTIYVSPRSRSLAAKAKSLEGYIRTLGDAEDVLKELK